MKGLRGVKTYFTFTNNTIKAILSYRANVVIFVLGDAMILAVTYYLWKAIFNSSPERILNGFSFQEMIIYVLLSFVVAIMIDPGINGTIYREVKDGSIAMNLIRPINFQKRIFFEGLGNFLYNLCLIFSIGFIAIIYLSIKYQGGVNLLNIILFMVSVVMAFCINFLFSYSLSLLSFKITNMWGLFQIMQAVVQLLSGALIPMVFFPSIVQKIFVFLPFQSMIYTPCMIYLGKLSVGQIIISLGIQFIWIILLYLLSKVMWKALIKNLVILGG